MPRQPFERTKSVDRPRKPRHGQVVLETDKRRFLRFNGGSGVWDKVEVHATCDQWIRPDERHTHQCIDGTPTRVTQCRQCLVLYRVERNQVELFKAQTRGECPTCRAPLPPMRDAIPKDFGA